ncbi:MAG TPA: 3-hydroxyacyl-ACP dehydratase FabZ [Armatimonadota bacterium]|jgi:beta-hydroxyacyl-ACP dehydratase FabZ
MIEMDIAGILETLPHRYPFLLVDRILELEPGRRAVGLKNVTMNEPQFTGHWPENPVMPGVLILEAMAQTGGVFLLCTAEHKGKLAFFGGVDDVRWRRAVRPGDQLIMEATLLKIRGNVGKVQMVATVEGEVACEGIFSFALVANKDTAAKTETPAEDS